MEITDEQIEYFLFEDGTVAGKRYSERAKFWEHLGLGLSGYIIATKQVRLEVALKKGVGDNLEQTLQGMEKVLPFVKEVDGVKRFKIFEHTLSEYGVYEMEITAQGCTLVRWTFGRKHVEVAFTTLRELLEYVQENHFYESSEDADED